MSAFCVYGMTITHAKKLAEKRLERGHDCKTKEEWKEKVGSIAEVILTSHAPVQVSPTFDAPPVRPRMDRGGAAHFEDLRTEGHGASTEGRQTRESSSQQDHWAADSRLVAISSLIACRP